EGIKLTKETQPDVVLMDINMPDMDGITATEVIRKEVPFTQIVILSVQGDQNYMRKAMLAGARDFLTKPPMVDELLSAIRRAGEMAHNERKKANIQITPQHVSGGARFGTTPLTPFGKVVLVYSPKGGVGCTTIATNLAVTLNNEDTPVVVVDGNLQFGDISIFLNERSKNSIVDLTPRAHELDVEVVENVLISHTSTGIKILAAPTRPEYSENVTTEQFTKVLEFLRRMFSYVIVDTSSTLTDVVLGAMDVSDLIILVATQDIPSINNTRLFLDLITDLGINRNKIVFTMNRYDKRIAITPQKVGDNLKQKVNTILPVEERIVVPSVNRGMPFMLNSKSNPVARGVLSLAEVVRERLSEIEEQLEGEQEGEIIIAR
ncbi:MAG: response regulator, partial [Anaerolineales bacterium]